MWTIKIVCIGRVVCSYIYLIHFIFESFLLEPTVTFTIPLKETTITEGDEVTLECQLSLPADVTWAKDGKPFKPDDHAKVNVQRTAARFSISSWLITALEILFGTSLHAFLVSLTPNPSLVEA